MQMHCFVLLLSFLFASAGAADHISINCGEDDAPEGSSTASTAATTAADPIPYATARISRSRFSYSFHLAPGQKFIRLHFLPAAYRGFESSGDFFTVEFGPFTLLANFSASITARALSVNVIAKEFCVIVDENGNQTFDLVFSPETSQSRYSNYAFVNRIEVIPVPSTVSYCHGGDSGVDVIGEKSVIYVNNATALERVYHHNIKWGDISFGHDMFGVWASILKGNGNKGSDLTWRVFVDVGFRYLVRVHLFDVGIGMDFVLMIDGKVALTSVDMVEQSGNRSVLWYNYIVMVQGKKSESKQRISISLHSRSELVARRGPIEGFEVFKLSNHDLSLASPNPLLPPGDSLSYSAPTLLQSLLGHRNAIATVVFTLMVNIVVHKMWATDSSKDENEPSARVKRPCRHFSLAEMKSATDNFHSRNIVGRGGFGDVLRGFMDNGREIVAIKRLKQRSSQGEQQFWSEVEILSELRHVNLVSLIGYCCEQKEMILVYEYMPNGTLADHLYKLARENKDFYRLSWKQRLKICIGAGRALDYLHTGLGIIHRDVKSSNILLDENFVAKISDFGLAKTGFGSGSQIQNSTLVRGTRGYLDPNYCETHKPTKNSDTYSFGVVLLEVLCGRRALERCDEEDKFCLTKWAIDKISKGQVDHIVHSSLVSEVSPDSLKTFVKVSKRCLHDVPKNRPAIGHVVMKLELALQQQDKAESMGPNEGTRGENSYSSTDKYQKKNMNLMVPNEKPDIVDALPQMENATSLAPEVRIITVAMPSNDNDRTILSTKPKSTAKVKTVTFLSSQQINRSVVSSRRQSGRKSMMHLISQKLQISQKLRQLNGFWKTRKPTNKMHMVGTSVSAPIANTKGISGGNSERNDEIIFSPSPEWKMLAEPNMRVFSLTELKVATHNFRNDLVLGDGGFGTVYKGWLVDRDNAETTIIAVKKLGSESMQGFYEWQSEVSILGKLSHPNLVKLLGYCHEGMELLLVYEFMAKGSLESHLFTRSMNVPPLPWDIRLKILIGTAHGLAFLHMSEKQVICRDLKPSNILLDGSYEAKLSDFGLAKLGPSADNSHVTTRIMGTYGYAAPEYIATGHLYVKSDVYGFGVVLLEMLTGLRSIDKQRPHRQHHLVDWMRPYLSYRKKLKKVMDIRLEGAYPTNSAMQLCKVAFNCLKPDPKSRPSMQEIVHTLEGIDSAKMRD
ncbi:putative receptor-like protein kinase At5g39000 isoform X1 [Salvia hispanica]|nr:putative receptor-like protein kinase At5g39000 isoform X1 [Salvia hispanica]